MPSPEQTQILWNLSDNELYSGATAFMHRLIDEEDSEPLPATQMTGLFNIANASSYGELNRFIRHQRERNWSESKRHIKTFYEELDKELLKIKKMYLPGFELQQDKKSKREFDLETDEIMAVMAREFIQHLIAENMLLLAKKADENKKKKVDRYVNKPEKPLQSQ